MNHIVTNMGHSARERQWRAFLRKTKPAAMPGSLVEVVSAIRDFLLPVLFPPKSRPAKWTPARGWSSDGGR